MDTPTATNVTPTPPTRSQEVLPKEMLLCNTFVGDPKVLNLITQELASFKDLDPNFSIVMPASELTDTLAKLDMPHMVKEPDWTECPKLAHDPSGADVKLTSHQLRELHQTGTFTVPSVAFPGQVHVWKISPVLQLGSKVNKAWRNWYLAQMYKTICVGIPNRILHSKEFSLWGSLKSIFKGASTLSNLLIGNVCTQPVHSEEAIVNLMKEYCLVKLKEQGIANDNYLLNDFLSNGAKKKHDIMKILDQPLNQLVEDWKTDKTDRKNQTHAKSKSKSESKSKSTQSEFDIDDPDYCQGNAMDGIDNSQTEEVVQIEENSDDENNSTSVQTELDLYQKKIFELVAKHLDPSIANLVIQIMHSIIVYQATIVAYEMAKEKATNDFISELERQNPIRSQVKEFFDVEMASFLRNYDRDHPYGSVYQNIISQLVGKDKKVFDRVITIVQSPEFNWKVAELKSARKPNVTFEWSFRIWNPKFWKTTQQTDQHYTVDKWHTVKTSTDYFFWRWGNIGMRNASYFNNINYYCLSYLVGGRFGLRSLWGLSNFVSEVGFNTVTGKPQYKYNGVTWIGRIVDLWNHIFQARKEFENAPDTDILGKSISRIFNCAWNYGVKGILGTVACFIGHPIATLVSSIGSLLTVIASPILAPLAAILKWLFDILVYDLDYSEKTGDSNFAKLFTVILWKFLAKGAVQAVVAAVGAVGHGLYGLWWFVPILSSGIRSVWDALVYHSILKHHARIPGQDGFWVDRIQGPGLSGDYYYAIDSSVALILLQYQLERLEIDAVMTQLTHQINAPENDLMAWAKQFETVGFVPMVGQDPFKKFDKTRYDALSKLRAATQAARPDLNISDGGKIRFDNKNWTETLTKGSVMTQQFIQDKVFPRLNSEDLTNFWSGHHLKPDNYHGLTIQLLKQVINYNIETTLEAADANGFRIRVQSEDAVKFIKNLFKDKMTEPDPVIEVSGASPNIVNTTIQSATNPNQVFDSDFVGFGAIVREFVQFASDIPSKIRTEVSRLTEPAYVSY